MTPEEAVDAMRDALAIELQLVAGLDVPAAYAAAGRAVERAGYLEVAQFLSTVDGTAGVFKTELLTHGPLPSNAVLADTAWTAARTAVLAHDINGAVLP